MGLIYDAGDSENLINALKNNLTSAETIADQLVSGDNHLIETVDSKDLSGAAYTAGSTLFVTIVNPSVQKVKLAIDDIKADLSSYITADEAIRGYGHIDKDHVTSLRRNLEILIEQTEAKIQSDNDLASRLGDIATGHVAEAVADLAEASELSAALEQMKALKKKYDKELKALETFVSQTSGLFTDNLSVLQSAMQAVLALNKTTFDSAGHYSTNGADMSFLPKIKSETLDNGAGGLTTKYKNHPKELKAIMSLAKDWGLSPLEAEQTYKNLKEIGKTNTDVKQIQESAKQFQLEFPSGKVSPPSIEKIAETLMNFAPLIIEDGTPAGWAAAVGNEVLDLTGNGEIKTDPGELSQEAAESEIAAAKIPSIKIENLPENVQKAYDGYGSTKTPWEGNYKGQSPETSAGGIYGNRNEALPKTDDAGNPITYKEFDVNSKTDSNRDMERFIVGRTDNKDGDSIVSIYYSDSHYGDGESPTGLPPFVRIK